jgi:hypothetical protein
MLTHRLPTRRTARLAAAAFGAAVLSTSALAGGPAQPDPPVPPEARAGSDAPVLLASAQGVTHAARTRVRADPRAVAEPDCRCGALYARDLERRVEGHVERWEAMRHDSGTASEPMATAATVTMPPLVSPPVATVTPVVLHVDNGAPVHLTALLVDGMLGFPLHDFRLAD